MILLTGANIFIESAEIKSLLVNEELGLVILTLDEGTEVNLGLNGARKIQEYLNNLDNKQITGEHNGA